MPEESRAAEEHALMAEITEPLDKLPDDPLPIAVDVDFPVVLRGYDRLAVDAYVRRMTELVAELQSTRSPDAAVRRALERVGEQISGILQRAHETAAEITTTSRREAEDRAGRARQEAERIVAEASSEAERLTGEAQTRLQELDSETDRIWAERQRIVDDTRALAQELLGVTEAARERFPPASTTEDDALDPDATVAFEAPNGAAPFEPSTVYDVESPAPVEPGEALELPPEADLDPAGDGDRGEDATVALPHTEPATQAGREHHGHGHARGDRAEDDPDAPGAADDESAQ